MNISLAPRPAAALLSIALLLPSLLQAGELGASIIVGEVTNEADGFSFVFTSTCPPGTSYQPQFTNDLGGTWKDVPDATVSEVEGKPGRFRVSAPTFGDEAAFYRVSDVSTTADAPIASTLDETPEPKEDQLLLLWNQDGNGIPRTLNAKLYAMDDAGPAGALIGGAKTTYASGAEISATRAQDALSVDLTGDGNPNPVLCFPDSDGALRLLLPAIASDGSAFGTPAEYAVPDSAISTLSDPRAAIRLVEAQLDEDELPEVALAWTGTDLKVHLLTLDFNGDVSQPPTFGPVDSSVQMPTSTSTPGRRSARFDLAAGNFDGDEDGIDEIAIVAARPFGAAGWRPYAAFFTATPTSLNSVGAITPADGDIYTDTGGELLFRIAAVAADFDGDLADELAVTFQMRDTSESDGRWFIRVLETDAAMTGITLGPLDGSFTSATGDAGYSMALEALQLDDDPELELISSTRQVRFFDVQAGLDPVSRGTGNVPADSSQDNRRQISLAQLESPADPDAIDLPEVISVHEFFTGPSSGNQTAVLLVTIDRITDDFDGTFFSLDEIASYEDTAENVINNNFDRTFTLVTAPFDPLDIRLGTPRRYTRIVANRPTVVLNAPPVHFDVIDGQEFDLPDMFPIADCPIDGSTGQRICPFFARFTRTSTETVVIETRWERSWDVSVKATGGFNIPLTPVGVEAEVRTQFGEEFDSYTANSSTTVVEVQIDAIDDDRLYATTLLYDLWEYPIVINGTDVVGTILLIDPAVTQQNWFPSKSVVAQTYRPYHEVGNLLSYRPVPEPYPGFDEVDNNSFDTFTVASTGGSSRWLLTKTSGNTTMDSRTFNFSIGSTLSFDVPFPFIPDVEVSGDYSTKSFASNTSTVEDTNGLAVTFGTLNSSIASAAYLVTPYFYWDRTGAVVLDYGVQLPLGTPGNQTFWGQKYQQKPDPTFILPWRNDPAKGLAVIGDIQRLTRDISTLPIEPRKGEAVTVQARVSNFSLLGVSSAISAKLYLGDPALGGILIHQTSIPAGLGPQAKHLIEFPYTIPQNTIGSSIDIYCVLDELDLIDEIHEDNNTAWGEILLRVTP